jgi:hypothetical protein
VRGVELSHRKSPEGPIEVFMMYTEHTCTAPSLWEFNTALMRVQFLRKWGQNSAGLIAARGKCRPSANL